MGIADGTGLIVGAGMQMGKNSWEREGLALKRHSRSSLQRSPDKSQDLFVETSP